MRSTGLWTAPTTTRTTGTWPSGGPQSPMSSRPRIRPLWWPWRSLAAMGASCPLLLWPQGESGCRLLLQGPGGRGHPLDEGRGWRDWVHLSAELCPHTHSQEDDRRTQSLQHALLGPEDLALQLPRHESQGLLLLGEAGEGGLQELPLQYRGPEGLNLLWVSQGRPHAGHGCLSQLQAQDRGHDRERGAHWTKVVHYILTCLIKP